MDSELEKLDIAYSIPHWRQELTLHLRHSANAWWKDASKVYRLLDAFDNHGATIDEACFVAGITKRQYKYFAQLHPVITKRRKQARQDHLHEQVRRLIPGVFRGSMRDSIKYVRANEPEEYDRRYKNPLARLRRLHGLPAQPQSQVAKSEKERMDEIRRATEKIRAAAGHPSDPEHCLTCPECRQSMR